MAQATLALVTNLSTGTYPWSVAVGDFNTDGRQDLAVVNSSSGTVSILLGDGAGNFSAAANFTPGSAPVSVAIGDFDGDGKQDLAVANFNSSNVSILLGDGAGSFSLAKNFPVAADPLSVAVGDFNGDGRQDLAVAHNEFAGTVSILLGDGTGNFSPATKFSAHSYPWSVVVGDFNGDGIQDLAVANSDSNDVSILLGDAKGNFGPPFDFGLPYGSGGVVSVAVGDFNGDGKQDLAAANTLSDEVWLFLRNCALTPTSVASRKTHGTAGPFDIDLPLTGNSGIECRTGGATNDHQLMVTYAGNVLITGDPQAAVTSGTGMIGSGGVSNGGVVTIAGNVVTVPLTNVANAQTINVTLFGLNGGGNLVIPMRTLAGDANESGVVNASDVSLVKSRMGQPVDATNFRSDVNADGVNNATDVAIIKFNLGTSLSLVERNSPNGRNRRLSLAGSRKRSNISAIH